MPPEQAASSEPMDAGALRYWHFALGAIVALLALLELWQDWRLSDKELAQHGQ